jgi:predicted dithiol-disulfide oxidoreductase (DUF899 family)
MANSQNLSRLVRKAVKHLLSAIDKAIVETANYTTHALRASAVKNGWDSDVVSSLHVDHNDGFKVKFADEHADRAYIHEYGNPSKRPTAVIRKYNNHHPDAIAVFKASIKRNLEKGNLKGGKI